MVYVEDTVETALENHSKNKVLEIVVIVLFSRKLLILAYDLAENVLKKYNTTLYALFWRLPLGIEFSSS